MKKHKKKVSILVLFSIIEIICGLILIITSKNGGIVFVSQGLAFLVVIIIIEWFL